MNKNILAVAIAAAVAAPSAFAAATVYGNAHMSADSISNGKDSVATISSNSSYIGVKGSEDLAGGMKAVFQFETEVGFDGESNTASTTGTDGTGAAITAKTTTTATGFRGQRNSFVGLNGGFGTVALGIHDTPLKVAGRKYDLFGDQIGDSRNLTGNGSWDLRPQNVAAYFSPSFNGFSAVLAYVADEENTKNGSTGQFGVNSSAYSALLNYTVGSLDASLAYESHDKGIHGKVYDAVRLGASYDFGSFKVTGLYANQDRATVGNSIKGVDIFGLGASAKVGPAGTVKGQFYSASEINNGNNGANIIAVGYDHALSKSTTAYVAYAVTNNDKAGTYGVAGGGHNETATDTAITGGKDPSAFSVGIRHKF